METSSKEENIPHSCCSIDDENCSRKVKFEWLEHHDKKSHKGISDRYLPIRKGPKSAKEIYLDVTDWGDDEMPYNRNDKKGYTVVDIYKCEVLGEDMNRNH